MKNKKLIYILLPIVVVIWGAIVFRFFSITNNKNELKTSVNSKNNQNLDNSHADTFSLHVNYRDPFLNSALVRTVNVSGNRSAKTNPTQKGKKDKETIKQVVKWPAIEYRGIIKNVPSEKKVIIVKIDHKEKIMSVGDTNQDIRLVEVYKDSIIVAYNNENKTIQKNIHK